MGQISGQWVIWVSGADLLSTLIATHTNFMPYTVALYFIALVIKLINSYTKLFRPNSYYEAVIETYPSFNCLTMHSPIHFTTDAFLLAGNKESITYYILWNNQLTELYFCLLWQVLTMCFITKTMPIHNIDSECHNKKLLERCHTGLIGCYSFSSLEHLRINSHEGGHTYMHTDVPHQNNFKKPGVLVSTCSCRAPGSKIGFFLLPFYVLKIPSSPRLLLWQIRPSLLT